MNEYFAIKNAKGRYLKVRTGSNGTSKSWVNDLKGATVGSHEQCMDLVEHLKKSPYYEGLTITEIGTSDSAWKAKLEACRKADIKRGTVTQKMVNFRCDLNNLEYLETKSNKGRFLNQLLAEARERGV